MASSLAEARCLRGRGRRGLPVRRRCEERETNSVARWVSRCCRSGPSARSHGVSDAVGPLTGCWCGWRGQRNSSRMRSTTLRAISSTMIPTIGERSSRRHRGVRQGGCVERDAGTGRRRRRGSCGSGPATRCRAAGTTTGDEDQDQEDVDEEDRVDKTLDRQDGVDRKQHRPKLDDRSEC